MARATANKLYRNFVAGFITEASPLTYPENASIDEDNCVLSVAGNRRRRFGINYNPTAAQTSWSVTNSSLTLGAVNSVRWTSVNNDSSYNFLVVQLGTTLKLFNASVDPIVETSLSLDMTPFILSGATLPENTRVSMVSARGVLYVVGKKIEPFYITYDATANTIAAKQIRLMMRDFQGVDDGLSNDTEPTTLTNPHKYNLMNQGWVDPTNDGTAPSTTSFVSWFAYDIVYSGATTSVIDQYHTALGRYPSNSQQWWLAQATADDDNATPPVKYGDFLPKLLAKTYFGNTRAPRGHFIFDAMKKDRSAVSSVSGIAVETQTTRPTCVGFYAGRTWYGHNNTLYFSQLLTDPSKAGFCYQEADPTSEQISDLVATDGGVIPIPEMRDCNTLLPVSNGLLVFAENGVWYISGSANGGFSALDFEVTKTEAIGTEFPGSIVQASEGQVMYWSSVGILGITPRMGTFGPMQGKFDRINMTQTKIQTFYNDIPYASKKWVRGLYDPGTNVVQWMYRSDDVTQKHFYDKILNLDLTLGAFYPWTVSSYDAVEVRPFIVDFFITIPQDKLGDRQTYIKYLTAVPNSTNYKFIVSEFRNSGFRDWTNFAGGGTAGYNYESYIITGYEILEDAMRKKMMPYVFCFFNQTETTWELTSNGDYTLSPKSSCFMTVRWNWSSSSTGGKWTDPVQVYRILRMPVMGEFNLDFDNGESVVVTKNKVRGSGKSIQFKLGTNERARDFDLLGWAVEYSGNTSP